MSEPKQLELFNMTDENTPHDNESKNSASNTAKRAGVKKTPSKKKAPAKVSGPSPEVKAKSTAHKTKKRTGKTPSPLPWTFPKSSLEDALLVARAIEDKNAGNPMRAADLAKAVGYNQPTDWRFLDLLRSANQYGLVSGTGKSATVSLEAIGQDVVAPSSPTQRQTALLNAFRNVEEFQRVESFYGGKRIPEDEFFENTLVREFSIPRERVQTFIKVFTENLRFLNLFNARRSEQAESESEQLTSPAKDSTRNNFPIWNHRRASQGAV